MALTKDTRLTAGLGPGLYLGEDAQDLLPGQVGVVLLDQAGGGLVGAGVAELAHQPVAAAAAAAPAAAAAARGRLFLRAVLALLANHREVSGVPPAAQACLLLHEVQLGPLPLPDGVVAVGHEKVSYLQSKMCGNSLQGWALAVFLLLFQ